MTHDRERRDVEPEGGRPDPRPLPGEKAPGYSSGPAGTGTGIFPPGRQQGRDGARLAEGGGVGERRHVAEEADWAQRRSALQRAGWETNQWDRNPTAGRKHVIDVCCAATGVGIRCALSRRSKGESLRFAHVDSPSAESRNSLHHPCTER